MTKPRIYVPILGLAAATQEAASFRVSSVRGAKFWVSRFEHQEMMVIVATDRQISAWSNIVTLPNGQPTAVAPLDRTKELPSVYTKDMM